MRGYVGKMANYRADCREILDVAFCIYFSYRLIVGLRLYRRYYMLYTRDLRFEARKQLGQSRSVKTRSKNVRKRTQ